MWVAALAVALTVGAFAGLLLAAPPAAAGETPPRSLGDPGSGWIPDVRVEANGSAQRRPSMTTHASGDLLMVYETNELGNVDVMFTRSSNGGLNWSTPIPVANGGADEVWPSIASDPESGRIFVAYQEGIAGGTTIMTTYSDDGAAWTPVIGFSCGVLCTRPRIASEYWNGSNNRQYIAFDGEVGASNWDVAVLRSETQGASWTFEYESSVPATDVRRQPDIAVFRGTDGVDRVAVFYRYGAAFPGTSGYMEWSADHGATWAGPSWWASNMDTPPVIAASHDGDSVLIAFNTAANEIWWAVDQDPTDLTWGGGTSAGSWTGAGANLALTVDGAGSTSLALGGSYHLVARSAASGDIIHTSAPVNVTAPADWTAIVTASDTPGQPSGTWPEKTATTASRGGSWWPVVAWTDFRDGGTPLDYNVFLTSPGATYTINTNPGALQVTVDGATGPAPVTGTWLAGTTHTVNAVSPQAVSAGARYAWINWTDGGAQSRSIAAGTADVALTANFGLEYLLTLTSARGGVTGGGWYGSGDAATISASSPQAGPPGERYAFLGWTGDIFSDQSPAYVLMNGPKVVNAAWGTEYQLTITTAHGTATQTAPDGWYPDGDVATVSLEAREVTEGGKTWRFVRWDGDATGTESNVTVEMDGPKNVTSVWEEQPGFLSGSTGVLLILVIVVVLILILAAVAMRRRKKPEPQFQQMQTAPAYGTVPPPVEDMPPPGPPAPPPPP